LTDAPCVPSPLCDKEMDSILLTNIKPLMLDLSLTLSPEIKLSDVSSTASPLKSLLDSDYSCKQGNTKSMINIIAEKKAYLLKHIADNENTDQLLALSQDHKLDQIAEKMARLVYEKLIAEQKVSKYSAVLRKLHGKSVLFNVLVANWL
ncbi:hypothetical protein LSH36_260g02004, partial [Paralvinella palmiformis]